MNSPHRHLPVSGQEGDGAEVVARELVEAVPRAKYIGVRRGWCASLTWVDQDSRASTTRRLSSAAHRRSGSLSIRNSSNPGTTQWRVSGWIRRHARASPPRPLRRPIPWAGALRRTFQTDVLTCPSCGGTRRVVEVVLRSTPHPAIIAPAEGPIVANFSVESMDLATVSDLLSLAGAEPRRPDALGHGVRTCAQLWTTRSSFWSAR